MTTKPSKRLPPGPWTPQHDRLLIYFAKRRVSYGAMAWDLNQPVATIKQRARILGLPAQTYVRGLDALDPEKIRRIVSRAWSWSEAADQLGVRSATVMYWCMHHGIALGSIHPRPNRAQRQTPQRPTKNIPVISTPLPPSNKPTLPRGWTRRDLSRMIALASPSRSTIDLARQLRKDKVVVAGMRLVLKLPPFMPAAREAEKLDARADRIRAVVTASWTWQQAAATLKLGTQQLRRWCKGHGFSVDRTLRPPRPYTPYNKKRIKSIHTALVRGKSFTEIAIKHGVSTQYISQVAIRLGLPSRRILLAQQHAALRVKISEAMQTATSVAEVARMVNCAAALISISKHIRAIDPHWARRRQMTRRKLIRSARRKLGKTVSAVMRDRSMRVVQMAKSLKISPFSVYKLIGDGSTGPEAYRVLRHLGIRLPDVLNASA